MKHNAIKRRGGLKKFMDGVLKLGTPSILKDVALVNLIIS